MHLVIATRNPHKLEEIRAVFNFAGLEVSSAFDYPDVPDVVEDGDTLEANAIKKAVELCQATGCVALADDSGLEVTALNGAPGVYSARWAGEGCTYADNNVKLLRELEGLQNRQARFRTVIALALPNGNVRTVEGICEGRIIEACRGEQGFGYDPLFVPVGLEKTFAELPAEEKNCLSHRGHALRQAQTEFAEFLNSYTQ
jgi:XTP/dITP diphosphohydrolase